MNEEVAALDLTHWTGEQFTQGKVRRVKRFLETEAPVNIKSSLNGA